MSPSPIPELTPTEFVALRQSGADVVLLDVREGWELDVARVDGIVHIPMGELVGRLAELDPARQTVVLCRSGRRSMEMAKLLAQNGFRSVANLKGGILAWGQEVDPNLATY
jgi:rhodanese-related sulfurtransferase